MERKKGFPLNNKLFYVSGMFLNWNSQKLFLERIILAVGIEKFGSLWNQSEFSFSSWTSLPHNKII